MKQNYEFVAGDEKIIAPGRTVKRIRARAAIAMLGVLPGDLGGYIESEANLSGDAWVSGEALVYGDAQVCGDAEVSGDADWILIGPAKSSGRFTTAHIDASIGVRVNAGCFTGTVDDFLSAIDETHSENLDFLAQYRAFHALIVANFSGVLK